MTTTDQCSAMPVALFCTYVRHESARALYNQHGDLLIFTKRIIYRIIVTIIDLSWECPGNKMPLLEFPEMSQDYVITFSLLGIDL